MRKEFEEAEVPYATLNRFGLTQEMIEDLPVDVLQEILEGKPSPVLPVSVQAEKGVDVTGRSRFELIRLEDGTTDVVFYPVLDELDLKDLSKENRKLLTERKVLALHMTARDGQEDRGLRYVQLDTATRQVMSVPTPVIARNLQQLAGKCNLSTPELQALQNGEVITTEENGEPLSIGIDLNAKTGIRLAYGDEPQWQKEGKRDWEKYNFGVYGCWIMNEDGNLDYIHDEDYSEEMWNEQKKQGLKQAHSRTL